MFNSSLRQAARTCPNAALTTRNIPIAAPWPAATFSTRGHQRRQSSSKPPIPPNDGSSSIPATSVKQVSATRSADKRPGAESRLSKRKGSKSEKAEQVKQIQEPNNNEWTYALPSVPGTQHLHPRDIYLASFFSTHRPISISGSLPETQIEDIDKIFQVKSRKTKARHGTADVIYTLSNAVQTLDEQIQNPRQQDPTVEQKVDLIKALTQHNNSVVGTNQVQAIDGVATRVGNVKVVIEEIARRFRPFNTPPAPVPVPEIDFQSTELTTVQAEAQADAGEEFQAEQLEIQIESQEPIVEQLHLDANALTIKSGTFFTPHRSLVIEPTPQRSIGGRVRKGIYVDPLKHQRNLRYHLISVKRQRRLKMKKHKYKKLMRKTRNLRRRQDRL